MGGMRQVKDRQGRPTGKVQVYWRRGGRGSTQTSVTFDDPDLALAFKTLLETDGESVAKQWLAAWHRQRFREIARFQIEQPRRRS